MLTSYPTPRPQIGRWWFYFSWTSKSRPWRSCDDDYGWRHIEIAAIKMHTNPRVGDRITRSHYRGAWLVLHYWLPWSVVWS
jgi:hypothetical protein